MGSDEPVSGPLPGLTDVPSQTESLSMLNNLRCTVDVPHLETYIAPKRNIIMSEMKSAYELAMERLGGESQELTEEQKRAIAEIDAKAKAEAAEAEIMFDQQLAAAQDPAKAALIRQTRQEQIAKIKNDSEAEKERIRNES
jgi:hypothetical protein